jgi:hypothetical protein
LGVLIFHKNREGIGHIMRMIAGRSNGAFLSKRLSADY